MVSYCFRLTRRLIITSLITRQLLISFLYWISPKNCKVFFPYFRVLELGAPAIVKHTNRTSGHPVSLHCHDSVLKMFYGL